MVNSRSLSDLLPQVAVKAYRLVELCAEEDLQIIITSTYRDRECQEVLYAQGRAMLAGPKATWCRPGFSWHEYRRAFDVMPLFMGKPCATVKSTHKAIWFKLGALGEAIGLKWGGRWEMHPDWSHFYLPEGMTLARLNHLT